MPSYAPSKLILIIFLVSIILSNTLFTIALNQTTDIGVIINQGSGIGKEQKTAIEIAIQKLNSGSKDYKLAIHFKNSSGDPLEAASSATDLINKQKVRVIIGTESWEVTALVAKIGQRARIPVMSLTSDTLQQPLSRLQWPFLVQMTNLNLSDEINCITSIVQSYNWKRVIVVYEDNVYGGEYTGVSLLSESLQTIDSIIEDRIVVPHFTSPFDPKETLRDKLVKVLTTKQSRVFIVLKSSLPTATRVFEEANKLGLMGRDSVWILGDSLSSLLDSMDPSILQLVQGAIGIKTYSSHNNTQFLDFRSQFKTTFRRNYQEEDKFEPGIYALRAYDSVETISRALNRLVNPNDNSSDFPEKLLDTIISSNFSGLTGQIAFQDGKLSGSHTFQLVNIIGKGYKELGFWSPRSGFVNNLDFGDNFNLKQLAINWPGDLIGRIPKGWVMPNDAKKMRIGVPDDTSFDRFVKVEWIESTNETIYSGFCIAVFKLVVETLEEKYGYTLPYEFVNHTGSYDDMVDKVYYKEYDAVVGDVTILANRSKFVEFTQPFTESGLSMVVPVKSEPHRAWKFMRPFTEEMWLATFGILFYTMFVVWFMEHQVNREFRGPWKDQLGTALWFTFSSLFFAHREKIRSNHSKAVVVIWLFVVFILSSSYTASLTSMLTVRMLEPTVRDIEWLRKTNASVGCDPDSFVGKYLTDVLKLKNIKNVSHQNLYPDNFKSGNIVAAFLELPYEKYFLKEYCNEYTAVGPSYKFGGLGFVFPKDSPITDDVSGAILSLLEEGKIRDMENEWLDTSQNCSDSNPGLDSERLSLANFWGIFLISGLASTISLLIFLYRLLHNRIEQRIISFNGSRYPNESRWRKTVRLIQIVLSLNHNRIQPTERPESSIEWNHRNPPMWELVSPTEVPEHLEIGRPTQLQIPMRKMEHIGEDLQYE